MKGDAEKEMIGSRIMLVAVSERKIRSLAGSELPTCHYLFTFGSDTFPASSHHSDYVFFCCKMLNIKFFLIHSTSHCLDKCHFISIPLCRSRKYAYSPPHGRHLFCTPPLKKFQLSLITLLLKFWLLRSPFPPGISDDLQWDGYGIFFELHILSCLLPLSSGVPRPCPP